MREAMLYQKLPHMRVRCSLCAHRCAIADGKKGVCHVRKNEEGSLYTMVYDSTIIQHIDPVEKKPLLHFHPASTAYSIATPGCNFQCRWCQNWDISQVTSEQDLTTGFDADPEQVVTAALDAGCRSIAYTYTEPTVFFEYTYETAKLAHAAGLANIYVTNGYMTPEMLEAIHPYLDAANVDLKAFREKTYRRYVGARLQPVLESLKRMKAFGIWLEVTTLVIRGINDDDAELEDAAQFVLQELGPATPWHISRFFPAYKMQDVPPTPTKTLRRAEEIGLDSGLRYVYCGNIPGEMNSFCHSCGRLLIRRSGFQVEENNVISPNRCPDCGAPVAGVGMDANINQRRDEERTAREEDI